MNNLFFILLVLLTTNSFAQRMWQINKDTVINWYYQDGDEFNDSTLNTEKWAYQFGWARSIYGNKEQQYYTDGSNHTLKDGKLNLYAKREKVTAKLVDYLPPTDSIKINDKFYKYNLQDFNYTSGMLQSKKNFQYGFFEIKCKIPKQKGFWPAFWLYGGTPNEEIDWIESKTEKPNQIHVGRHSKIKSENKFRAGWHIKKKWWGDWLKFKGNLNQDFNIISGEWDQEYIKYYLNGECIAYTKLKMPEHKSLVANLAVPSNNGPFKPGPDTLITRSEDMVIDYIRVWTNDETKQLTKSRNTEISKKFHTTHSTLAKSTLKSKTKMHYGGKKIHKNDGLFVTLSPANSKTYHLLVTGKEIPINANYKIVDTNDIILESGKLIYGTNEISVNKPNESLLIIQCYNQIVTYHF